MFGLDELGRITLEAAGDDTRYVETDETAGLFAAVKGDAIIAPPDALLATTGYRDWLKSQ